jgi:glycopeptide antibiotics resistance protein
MRSIIDTTVYELLSITWPTLLIAVVLVVTIRIGYLLKHREEFVFYKEIMYLCFMLYILCLFQVVTTKDLNNIDGNNLRLFSEILRYDFGSRLFYKNIIGNVLMFVPYGFFSCTYIKLKNPLKAFILIFIASLSIEITQLAIGRVFDVDDILLNVLGGMLGYFTYIIASKLGEKFPMIKKETSLNIITIIGVIITILVIIWR